MTSYKKRLPTEEEKLECHLCADGWPVVEGSDGSKSHEMPEPAGMVRHLKAAPKPAPSSSINNKHYLGDGVHASFDGYQLWLHVDGRESIALDTGVYAELRSYARRINQHAGCMYFQETPE